MTSNLDHALALFGVTDNTTSPFWLLPGRQVTRINWMGCMAYVRKVEKVGHIIRRESRWQNRDGRLVVRSELKTSRRRPIEWPGVIVRYPSGDQWEAESDVRFIGGPFGAIEVWR